MISVIEPALVWDDRSSGYQVRVTAGGAHTEKLEHGPRYGFGLFQHHEVSGMRQVDHSHPLAHHRPTAHAAHAGARAERVPHRALGSGEGGRSRRSTNLQGVRSGWSRDARDGPQASIRLVPVPWDRMLARASARPTW